MLKIIVFGGDGFCGWPASLELASAGHDVLIVDSLIRRDIDQELGVESLTPIQNIHTRIESARKICKGSISFAQIDISVEYDKLLDTLLDFRPDAVVHYAEQRAAPYSMKSSWHRRYTVTNNISATHNILSAIVDAKMDIHLVHLGTMGVYGYNTIGAVVPEGYLDIQVPDASGDFQQRSILYPADPGSVYHMTKTQDQLLFYFYNKNYKIRITDLHQGIVWGTNTALTLADEALVNRFDYDGDFGTVLNRFLMQASCGYPLTVHGSGGQERAFIHIKDSVQCIRLALEAPPASGDRVRIFNQATEVHKVIDLAHLVAKITGSEVQHVTNPRIESENNELKIKSEGLIGLGLNPTRLNEGLMVEILETAQKYKHRANPDKIPCTSNWRA